MFTIEFFRIRKEDNAHAMLDRVTYIASDLESAKVKEAARQKKTGAADISPLPTQRLMTHEKPRRHEKNSAQNALALATFEQ